MKDDNNMERLTIQIEKLVSGAVGFSRLDQGVVFTPFALPGETVEVEIEKQKKDFAFARILDVKEASDKRIAPACPFFGTCGGCQLQMTDYETQLEHKRNIIEDSVRRIAKIGVKVNPVIASDKPFHYRNKGSFQVFRQHLGYCFPGTKKAFEVTNCPIMEKPINQKLQEFSQIAAENEKLKKMRALVIRTNHQGETINSTIKRDSFKEKAAGLNFLVDVDTFFQVNRTIIPKWLSYIKNLVLNKKVGEGLLDLYCGVGIISQYLASSFEEVIGIEINKRLVENGNQVLKENGIDNAQFIIADAGAFDYYGFKYDSVIINPPRKGISYRMVKALAEAAPKLIIYSSCNPDTFARDISQLSENGYFIDEIQPFDMFPQTQHSEVVGVLYRK